MLHCSVHGTATDKWTFLVALSATLAILSFCSVIFCSRFVAHHGRNGNVASTYFYLFAALTCVFEVAAQPTQFASTTAASFLHECAAFCYIAAFTLVLTHW